MTRAVATAVALLFVACTSSSPDTKKSPVDEPDIRISQISDIAEAARHITGAISVQYRVDVGNRSKDPITVKRIDVVSLGAGAYALRPASVPFDAHLNPGESQGLQFWGTAVIDDPTIVGANGPVTLRVTVQYATPSGTAQSIVIQQVHAMP